MTERLSIAVLLAALAAAPLAAAEGRIPLHMPSSIAQPGHYIVTRDIMAAAGPVISIMAGGVTLDLNGHTIGTTDSTQPVVRIIGAPGSEEGIIVIDGRVQGGMHGILHAPPAGEVASLTLSDLQISGTTQAAVKGVGFSRLAAQGIIIVNSLIGFDLQASAPGTPPDPIAPSASIRNASIRGGGGIHCAGVACSIRDYAFTYDPPDAAPPTPAILFSGATGGEAVGIIIINSNPAGGIVPCVLDVVASSWITIADAKVIGPAGGIAPCVHADSMSRDVVVRDSVFTNCGGDGIRVEGTNGILRGNLVSGAGGHGIFAGGSSFIIGDGKLSGNAGAGIWFETSNHVYRANILRGNTGGGVAGPGASDAINAGGNVE